MIRIGHSRYSGMGTDTSHNGEINSRYFSENTSNVFEEDELAAISAVAYFATTAADGKI